MHSNILLGCALDERPGHGEPRMRATGAAVHTSMKAYLHPKVALLPLLTSGIHPGSLSLPRRAPREVRVLSRMCGKLAVGRGCPTSCLRRQLAYASGQGFAVQLDHGSTVQMIHSGTQNETSTARHNEEQNHSIQNENNLSFSATTDKRQPHTDSLSSFGEH